MNVSIQLDKRLYFKTCVQNDEICRVNFIKNFGMFSEFQHIYHN